jgi:hypothetical protein
MRRLMMAALFVVAAVTVVLAAGCGGDTPFTGDTSPNTKQQGKEGRR